MQGDTLLQAQRLSYLNRQQTTERSVRIACCCERTLYAAPALLPPTAVLFSPMSPAVLFCSAGKLGSFSDGSLAVGSPCADCPVGTTTAAAGSRSADSCKLCAAGYGGASAASCTPCKVRLSCSLQDNTAACRRTACRKNMVCKQVRTADLLENFTSGSSHRRCSAPLQSEAAIPLGTDCSLA